jgi:hypothetical protein
MASWSEVERAAPELAGAVKERFEAYGLALLATLRRDGSPRISGLEPLFASGELWLGMMPDSRKADDLLRDPRFALHNATTDKAVTNGDVKVNGRAVPVEGEAGTDAFRAAFKAHTGTDIPAGPIRLFRADVTDISSLRPGPGGDHLIIEWWREGEPPHRVERR